MTKQYAAVLHPDIPGAAVTGVRRHKLPDRPAHPRDHSSLPQSTNNLFFINCTGETAISYSASSGASVPLHLDHGEMTRPPGGSGHLIIDTRLSPPTRGGCVAHR